MIPERHWSVSVNPPPARICSAAVPREWKETLRQRRPVRLKPCARPRPRQRICAGNQRPQQVNVAWRPNAKGRDNIIKKSGE